MMHGVSPSLSRTTMVCVIALLSLKLNANQSLDPTDQSDFSQQVVSNVTAIEPGHQCYKVANIPDTVESGTNATIQLEYWSNMDNELGGRNQSFFACADIVSTPTYYNTLSYPGSSPISYRRSIFR